MEIIDGKLYIWDLKGPMACPETQKGIYDYEVVGNSLNLTLVEDECDGRNTMAPSANWVKE